MILISLLMKRLSELFFGAAIKIIFWGGRSSVTDGQSTNGLGSSYMEVERTGCTKGGSFIQLSQMV